MSVVHILDHADFGQLQIEDPECVAIDSEGKHEHYVMIVHCVTERTPWSLHTSKADAKRTAVALAKRLRCEFLR